MNVFTSKLTKRYLLITVVVTLFVLSSVYWFTIQVMNTSFQEQIKYRDEVIARTLGKRIDILLNKMVSDMRTASTYLETDKHLFSAEMPKVWAREPLYYFIQTFDDKRKLIARIPEVPFPTPLNIDEIADRLAWSKTLYLTNMITLPNGKKTIAIAYPKLNEQGEYRGGVIAYLNLSVLSEYIKELKIGKQGINIVIDREGSIIAHSNVTSIGQSLKEHEVGIFLKKQRYGIWEGELSNQRMIAAYRPMTLGQFGLIVAEPIGQAWAPSYKVMELLIEGFLVVLLVAIGLSVYGTSRVVKPIMGLIQQAKEYKENKRKSFDIIHTKDELEELFMTMDQMAKELRNKERKLYYILESIPYCVITTDKEGKITTFNRGAEELTLYRRDEVIGNYIFDIPLKEKKEEFMSWQTLKEGKEFDEAESYILDKYEKKHDVKAYSSFFRGEDQKLLGAILVFRDVSEIKRLEEYAKQTERLAALGQLTAGIAHEIKNPLSIIQAAAEAIDLDVKDKGEHGFIQEMTGDILETADRMNRLLTDFLKLSKGEQEERKQELNLARLLNELLQLLRRKMKDQEVRVERQFNTDNAMVFGNKNKLSQVFLNIFLNSLQAMEQGGTLAVRLEDDHDYWKVEIEDTGKGIPSTMIQWIFNPFFSTKREGTGLGLSIAHEILLQHEGKIWATSTEGQGTTLFVQIPKQMRGENDEKDLANR
ncbi:ATP-binding protein [Ammoniphilus sp. 3BR4]|uniref:sensor histidine kinase n=1 Tax=Ammoniphilus sp. 3BR4 TaxID=3158265 RepID=UPI00346593CA